MFHRWTHGQAVQEMGSAKPKVESQYIQNAHKELYDVFEDLFGEAALGLSIPYLSSKEGEQICVSEKIKSPIREIWIQAWHTCPSNPEQSDSSF